MSQEQKNLEKILNQFDQVRDWFQSPLTLSYENHDVTVKYLLSMLKIDQREEEDLVGSFCIRFDVDKTQMEELLGNKDHFVEYSLFVAFCAHAQQRLGLGDDDFFTQTTDHTFLDYQNNPLIGLAKFLPLDQLLAQISSQFENWTIVTDTKTYNNEGKVHITRRTKDIYRNRLLDLLGQEVSNLALYRDCDFTLCSFKSTFQKLYGQERLEVQRIKIELSDGEDQSEYVVDPRLSLYERGKKMALCLRDKAIHYMAPWIEMKKLRLENDRFRGEVFDRQTIIREMTNDLSHKNAELENRQAVIINLLTDISRMRSSGGRHGIRNLLQSTYNTEKDAIFTYIASHVVQVHTRTRGDTQALTDLEDLCAHFGIESDDLTSEEKIKDKLYQLEIRGENDGTTNYEETIAQDEGFDNMDTLFGDLFDDTTNFNDAYQRMRENKGENTTLGDFNPFSLVRHLKSLKTIMGSVNEQFSRLDSTTMLNQFKFSSTYHDAITAANKDKRSGINVITDFQSDPQFNTNKDLLTNMLRDIFYNSIDAGAKSITIKTRIPSKEEDLPFFDDLTYKSSQFPALYICLEDNGSGITQEKADEITSYLRGEIISIQGISDKGKSEDDGGLGTKNLKRFSDLHGGQIFYEPVASNEETGTKVHIYIQRLSI